MPDPGQLPVASRVGMPPSTETFNTSPLPFRQYTAVPSVVILPGSFISAAIMVGLPPFLDTFMIALDIVQYPLVASIVIDRASFLSPGISAAALPPPAGTLMMGKTKPFIKVTQ